MVDHLTIVLYGILIGMGLSIMSLGPSFFYLLRIGINRGFKEAAFLAFGIALSDAILVSGIFLGLGDLIETDLFQEVFSLIAGFLILGMGGYYLFKKPKIERNKQELDSSMKGLAFTAKGFSLNILNPFTFIMWLFVSGWVSSHLEFKGYQFGFFFSVLILSILCMDMTKAYFANWLGKVIKESTLLIIDRVLGGVFVVLSIRLFYHFFEVYLQLGQH